MYIPTFPLVGLITNGYSLNFNKYQKVELSFKKIVISPTKGKVGIYIVYLSPPSIHPNHYILTLIVSMTPCKSYLETPVSSALYSC